MNCAFRDSAIITEAKKRMENPLPKALLATILITAILLPYWWLAVQWFEPVLTEPGMHFTFSTTTFLFVLIIADSTFLIRYYQLLRRKEMNEMVEELRIREEALRTANNKLNLLSTITRHDILNQIMALKYYIEILKEETESCPDIVSEMIEKEEKVANAIEGQINFTRDYQDMGAQAPVWQNIAMKVWSAKRMFHLGDVHVCTEGAESEMFADPAFEKVFYNLIDNSLRYGGSGLTEIRIKTTETDTGLLLTIEDDGTGIPEDEKERIFSRGFGQNTGLGLFLCREILALTGIEIRETGIFGEGARFELSVPKGMYRFASGGKNEHTF